MSVGSRSKGVSSMLQKRLDSVLMRPAKFNTHAPANTTLDLWAFYFYQTILESSLKMMKLMAMSG